MQDCPICGSDSTSELFTHAKWNVPCLSCNDCRHAFASELVDEVEDSFITNRKRAGYYLNALAEVSFHTVMDIGTPSDFYFLKEIHKKDPTAGLFALDLYEKDHPEFIELIHDFAGTQVDLCTAFHVMEHVPDPAAFLQSMLNACRYFIIEVPACDSIKRMRISSSCPHMHFFTTDSFKRLFTLHADQATVIPRYDANGFKTLVACSLPSEVYLPKSGGPLNAFLKKASNTIRHSLSAVGVGV